MQSDVVASTGKAMPDALLVLTMINSEKIAEQWGYRKTGYKSLETCHPKFCDGKNTGKKHWLCTCWVRSPRNLQKKLYLPMDIT